MSKTYSTPSLTVSGTVVRETLGSGQSAPAENTIQYKSLVSGSVGFYL